jgi:hypothetical protein
MHLDHGEDLFHRVGSALLLPKNQRTAREDYCQDDCRVPCLAEEQREYGGEEQEQDDLAPKLREQ